MSWFKIDDGLPSSRKVLSIPRDVRCQAMGLWALGGAWVSKELQDGLLPKYMLEELCGTMELAHVLVEAGLWIEHDDAFEYHDWDEYQPRRDDVIQKRKRNAERLRVWREKNSPSNSACNSVTNTVSTQTVTLPPTRPDPTRPDPLVLGTTSATRGRRIDTTFTVTPEMTAWAQSKGFGHLDLDRLTEEFVDYWTAVAGQRGVKLDWTGTWRNWVRRKSDDTPNAKRAPAARNPNIPEGW